MRALARRDEDIANVGGVDEFYERRRSDVTLPVEGGDVLPVPTICGARSLMIFTPFSVKGMSVEPVCDQGPYQCHIEWLDVAPYVSSFNLVLSERDRSRWSASCYVPFNDHSVSPAETLQTECMWSNLLIYRV